MHHFQAVAFEEKIYVIGALTGLYLGETPIPNIYIYDPSKDEWTKSAEIPEERRRGSAGGCRSSGQDLPSLRDSG